MKSSDIINLWKTIGWNTTKDYHDACITETFVIDDLCASKVDSQEFWLAAQQHFLTDPVSNSRKHKTPFDIKQANKANHELSIHLGMIGQLDMARLKVKYKFGEPIIAEIGCGYGSFHQHYITPNNIKYTGFDVVTRFEGSVKIEGRDGTFSDSQVEHYREQHNIFYSANVFQHLSPLQIAKYLRQIYEMLPYGGYANVMYVHDTDATFHYGQKIDVLSEAAFLSLIEEIGYRLVSSTKSYSGELKPFSLLIEK